VAAGFGLREAARRPLDAVAMVVLATFAAIAGTLTLRIETRNRDWFLFSVPLYGRELARALSVVPVVVACAFSVTVAIYNGAGDRSLAAALIAPVAPALIVESATLRAGKARLLYLGLAVLAGLPIATMISLISGDELAIAATAATAFVISFAALRAYGETLARFDPL
jgi:hypothetical protein